MNLSRRAFITVSAATPVALALGKGSALRAWQQQPAPITGVFTPIRKDVGYFTGRGGTIGYLINKDGVLVVDTQSMDAAAICIAGLQERSNNRGVDVLINTHHHGDHTGGNMAFKTLAKRHVANARAVELQKQVYETAVKNAAAKGSAAPPEILVASRTFTDAWGEKIGKEKITARTYTPAHTSGDAIVVFEEANVVHMGDLMFNRRHPVIDKPAGASIANWIKKLEEIHKKHHNDTVFISGHNNTLLTPIATRADLLNFRDYLTSLLAFTGGLVKEGRPKDEVTARKDVLKGFEDYGPLTAGPLSAAFDEITTGK
ncbi:MAG: MBL fold metallo-hydrolase [Acidobacteria bacterium]|nr:MAG: MBL fold metallo-hydrolase [Acidobacteriota bacterium]